MTVMCCCITSVVVVARVVVVVAAAAAGGDAGILCFTLMSQRRNEVTVDVNVLYHW